MSYTNNLDRIHGTVQYSLVLLVMQHKQRYCFPRTRPASSTTIQRTPREGIIRGVDLENDCLFRFQLCAVCI